VAGFVIEGRRRRSVCHKNLNVTPKTAQQHLVVRSGKPEAGVTITEDSARGITPLKLTTDGHKASRSLSATAELLVNLSL